MFNALDEIAPFKAGPAVFLIHVQGCKLGKGSAPGHFDQCRVGIDDAAVGGGTVNADGHVFKELAVTLLALVQGFLDFLVVFDVDNDKFPGILFFIHVGLPLTTAAP